MSGEGDDKERALEARTRARLALLRQEFEAGRRQLHELDQRRAQLTDTMLRISGAIQALEELLAEGAVEPASPPKGAEPETPEGGPPTPDPVRSTAAG